MKTIAKKNDAGEQWKSRWYKLVRLFAIFFKIGFFTVGGGYVMLPIIERELVDKRNWFDKDSFVDLIAISQTVPGALAVNTAFQAGYHLYGIKGGLCAVLGAILPSFIIILAAALLLFEYSEHTLVTNFFRGALPAVVALVTAAAWRLGRNVIYNARGLILFLVLLVLGYLFLLHPFIIITLGAAGGALLFRRPLRCKNNIGDMS